MTTRDYLELNCNLFVVRVIKLTATRIVQNSIFNLIICKLSCTASGSVTEADGSAGSVPWFLIRNGKGRLRKNHHYFRLK